jgi:kynureninase
MGSVEQPSMKVEKPSFPSEANSLEYAQSLDAKDHMRKFRDQFIIPSKANIKATKLAKPGL